MYFNLKMKTGMIDLVHLVGPHQIRLFQELLDETDNTKRIRTSTSH